MKKLFVTLFVLTLTATLVYAQDTAELKEKIQSINNKLAEMMLPQMGDQPWSDHGKYMTIWEMQDDGSLKVKVETWNTDVNPWMEMQKTEKAPEGNEGHQH